LLAVPPEGANHQWRRNPSEELSIDPVAAQHRVQAKPAPLARREMRGNGAGRFFDFAAEVYGIAGCCAPFCKWPRSFIRRRHGVGALDRQPFLGVKCRHAALPADIHVWSIASCCSRRSRSGRRGVTRSGDGTSVALRYRRGPVGTLDRGRAGRRAAGVGARPFRRMGRALSRQRSGKPHARTGRCRDTNRPFNDILQAWHGGLLF
jgi:hypothetical protein